jgi:AraC family transcriptional regulator of adaptative response / DNA-3-methyladenine glycosylase II
MPRANRRAHAQKARKHRVLPAMRQAEPPRRCPAIHVRKPRDIRDRARNDDRMDLDDNACYRAIATRDRRFDGRLFIAVKTTGVYCRPVCPARTPKRQNVRFFASAAAAQEAGFRPCLRCRPETSPDLGAWRGTSNTVSRALALIEAGGLDEARVEALGERLGVGERQLRRLFKQHLGASPIAVAQTRRVLLAKQLIHDTQLPMAEVALAAGFGSVRRFNETFQALYSRPPGFLRRHRRIETSAAAAGELTLRLPYRAPYDWDAILAFLAARAIPGVECVRDGMYARTVQLDGATGAIFIRPGEGAFLQATVRFPRLASLPAIIARVRRVFDLAADPSVIGAHLAEDELLAPLVGTRPGLRVPGAWDGFELAIRAILGQQITVSAARGLAAKLVATIGTPIEDARANAVGLTHVFPSAARVAQADLSKLGMPRARIQALQSLAQAHVDDPALFSVRRDLDAAIEQLCALRGIGEWTAQYIAMRELRESDAFPVGDVALVRAISNLCGSQISAQEMLKRAERWRPWRAYATIHLWASLSAAHRESRALSPAAPDPSARKAADTRVARTPAATMKTAAPAHPPPPSASSKSAPSAARKPRGSSHDRRRAA